MSFAIETYVFAFLLLVFSSIFVYVSYRERGFARFVTGLVGVSFFSLAVFAVMVALAFSVEYSAQAPCENVINLVTTVNDTVSYTYLDSCAGDTVPKSLSMLYVAYSYIVLLIIFLVVFALMFLGLQKVIRW